MPWFPSPMASNTIGRYFVSIIFFLRDSLSLSLHEMQIARVFDAANI
jgi:hypothetical protein